MNTLLSALNTLLSALKSRTVRTALVLVLINGVPAIRDQIPVGLQPVVDAVLGLLAIYFRVNVRTKIL